jgi:hypothetical protein
MSTKDTRTGAERIADERQRQIDKEGYKAEHDDEHTDGSLAWAAVCYAAPEAVYVRRDWATGIHFEDPWPWSDEYDKRASRKRATAKRIRLLEMAGALIAAEIDRLLRRSKHAYPVDTQRKRSG